MAIKELVFAAAKPLSDKELALKILKALKAAMYSPTRDSSAARENAWKHLDAISKILPVELRSAPPVLYRCFMLSEKQYVDITNNVLNGIEPIFTITSEGRRMSSWTTSKSLAEDFSNLFMGSQRDQRKIESVFKKTIPQKLILINILAAWDWAKRQFSREERKAFIDSFSNTDWLEVEKEIVVKNTPFTLTFSKEDFVSLGSTTAKDFAKKPRNADTDTDAFNFLVKEVPKFLKTYDPEKVQTTCWVKKKNFEKAGYFYYLGLIALKKPYNRIAYTLYKTPGGYEIEVDTLIKDHPKTTKRKIKFTKDGVQNFLTTVVGDFNALTKINPVT